MQRTEETEAIREWLNVDFFSRDQIARLAGINRATGFNIARGQNIPLPKTIDRFKEAAVVRREALLTELNILERVLK